MKRLKPHLLLAALILSTSAGKTIAKEHYLGIRCGMNSATLVGDVPTSLDRVTRLIGGAVALFMLTDWVWFQPEVLYSSKGAKGLVPVRFFGARGLNGTFELNYQEVPLRLSLYPRFGFSRRNAFQL